MNIHHYDLEPDNRHDKRSGESGNIMVYILLGVSLLAALSFAVAQGSRSNIQAVTDERARLVATDLINYADTMEKAVTQLRLRGTRPEALSFAHPDLSDGDYGTYTTDSSDDTRYDEVFNPAGGSVIYRPPPSDATISGSEDYMFLSHNEIQGVGTSCGAASCADLLMAVANLREKVCVHINELIGVNNSGGTPPVQSAMDTASRFSGSFGYSQTIGTEPGSSALFGQSEGCFYESGGDRHIYYKVLLAR